MIVEKVEELQKLLLSKNEDYHSSFARSRGVFVPPGAAAIKLRLAARQEDKLERIEALMRKDPAVVSESLADTKLDLAGYLILEQVLDTLIEEGLVV